MSEFHDNYSFLDKLLHRLAFNSTSVQLRLAEVESEEHRQQLAGLKVEKPVFITSLPRSGTTILLEVLSKTGLFCHHTYQDMPFVFTPLLWHKFAGRFAKRDELVERAHGDGIKINQHSPEAFEEMFYKAHWPNRYRGSTLSLWPEQMDNPAFEGFFYGHIRKLMLRDDKSRYLSKNNLNILRLDYLKRLFPDGCFVVPFRDPVEHAMSLLRQHLNFSKMHQSNGFAKSYMAGIGHFDFGDNLKPVEFGNWLEQNDYHSDDLNFWLAYWIACYEHLLATKPYVHFVCFEQLCADPNGILSGLAGQLDIEPGVLLEQAGQIKQGKPRALDIDALNSDNLAKARALYQDLLNKTDLGQV